MPWIKIVHLASLVCWCGALLHVLAAAAWRPRGDAAHADDSERRAMTRVVFAHWATPAALVAIVSGSALFLLQQRMGLWLVAKLVVVTALVLCHVLAGWIIIRQDNGARVPRRGATLVGLAASGFMLLTLWLVLAKPL